ncbi:hypothetical protein [Actinoallomurus iriomotensis]|uniref:HNH endonuclease n=1 Tax=Actinoallomurus iriomotensis TaxID=478107 RepID=A0A9W6S5K6_9ACTN|nr:hypothetical protein [Actinoallomurus iriomotensis]GLY86042.1 hypothetical protein Airi02_039710 [Actinoallomurus iriomotensis]
MAHRLVERGVLAAVVLSFAAGAGCSSTATGSPSAPARTASTAPKAAGGAIPMGPGPQHPYTVRNQPPAGSCHYRHTGDGQPLPDSSCTPGALNPDVTQATLATTICRPSGYTRGIRPPAEITGTEKRANAASYGFTDSLHDAEYDHLVSLELGGDPNDPHNLWVEPPSPGHAPGSGPNNPKDAVENHLHTAICARKVTLSAAQQAIATDWTTAESSLGLT